jgi:hypothetical protein
MRFPVVTVVAIAGCATALAGCGPLDREEFTRGVKTIRSLSAEGALIADGAARDRTKITFVRVHAADLSDEAQHESEKLHDATPSRSLPDRDVARAILIAGDAGSALDDLRVAPDDPVAAEKARAELLKATRDASDLLDQL